ncbi:hypothetical protein AMCSP14_002226 [Streptococcus pneumoniae 2070531]|nr:hypothetical protein SP195_1529 [Streptococcus pneumoniae SP195]EGI82873.1 hypothetical protein SPAR50_1560 [Streptococcus pneumoniae GA17570]EHD76492.1 hypothetical protein SPAR86_1577 [Streptococcus pneumoniae GA44511]EHE35054.1 hypothetical protein SPAR96_1530 [Streptococcus pneumoniae GA47388]EHE66164.1 hypothetical protein SPAR17_1542 [Streptococcus pneumoniae GA08780]EHZ46427.1 hypothetical protein SPAR75_1526 [Streptococcus pneumoniae GA43257]EJG45510.1 hypothetical protein AMCSP14_
MITSPFCKYKQVLGPYNLIDIHLQSFLNKITTIDKPLQMY